MVQWGHIITGSIQSWYDAVNFLKNSTNMHGIAILIKQNMEFLQEFNPANFCSTLDLAGRAKTGYYRLLCFYRIHAVFYLWCGLRRQKKESQTWISNCISQNTVECNYLSPPEISASCSKVLKWWSCDEVVVITIATQRNIVLYWWSMWSLRTDLHTWWRHQM